MEGLSSEELMIEAGKSAELATALRTVDETTVANGRKFSEQTCHDLARLIACRSYGTVMLELAHLMVVASACDPRRGRYEPFFWNVGPARPAAFRSLLAQMARSGGPGRAGITVAGPGVEITYRDGVFAITYGRMPLLAAMVEFLATTLGYDAFDAAVQPLIGRHPDRATVADVANALSRALYDYLRSRLTSVQNLRKMRRMMGFLRGRAGHAEVVIDDAAVLHFWLDNSAGAAAEAEGDFKTYANVFRSFLTLGRVLREGRERYAIDRARPIGPDRESGEVDPAEIEEAVRAMDEAPDLLRAFEESPLERIKFLNKRERDDLEAVLRCAGDDLAFRLSILRCDVFGKAQNRIANRLRERPDEAALVEAIAEAAAEQDYGARIQRYAALAAHGETVALACLHGLLVLEDAAAVTLILALRPDVDLRRLADQLPEQPAGDADADGTVVRFPSRTASAQSGRGHPLVAALRRDPGAIDPALAELVAAARRAHRGLARQGLRDGDLEDPEVAAGFRAAAGLLVRLHDTLDRFARGLQPPPADHPDWTGAYGADSVVFLDQFRRIYGVHP